MPDISGHPCTSKIIKAGALLADTRTFLAHWDKSLSETENLARFRQDNLFGKASRSRVEDILVIFMIDRPTTAGGFVPIAQGLYHGTRSLSTACPNLHLGVGRTDDNWSSLTGDEAEFRPLSAGGTAPNFIPSPATTRGSHVVLRSLSCPDHARTTGHSNRCRIQGSDDCDGRSLLRFSVPPRELEGPHCRSGITDFIDLVAC